MITQFNPDAFIIGAWIFLTLVILVVLAAWITFEIKEWRHAREENPREPGDMGN